MRPDGCDRLGPALATIRRAKTRPEAGANGVTVVVDLAPGDGAAVRSALAGQVSRQIAMVMFGRVLSAPTIKNPSYTLDSIAVAPIDPQTAANVIRSLGG